MRRKGTSKLLFKKKYLLSVSIVFLLFTISLFIAPIFFKNVEAESPQEDEIIPFNPSILSNGNPSGDPLDEVKTYPYAGETLQVEYYTPSSHPEEFYVDNAGEWKPYIFADTGDGSYTITIHNAVYEVHDDPVGVRVFSRNGTMVIAYSYWTLQQWESKKENWKDIVISDTELSYELHDDRVIVSRNNTIWINGQQSFFLETYELGCVESGKSVHKVSLEWNYTVTDSDNTYRFYWNFRGIPENKNINDGIFSNYTRIVWWDDIDTTENYPVIIDWLDANETFDYIDIQGASDKLDIYFDNSTLEVGEKIAIDPSISISDESGYTKITTPIYALRVSDTGAIAYNWTVNGNNYKTSTSTFEKEFRLNFVDDGTEYAETLQDDTFTPSIEEDDSDFRVYLKLNRTDTDWGGSGNTIHVYYNYYFYRDFYVTHAHFDSPDINLDGVRHYRDHVWIGMNIAGAEKYIWANSTYTPSEGVIPSDETTLSNSHNAIVKYPYVYYRNTTITETFTFDLLYDDCGTVHNDRLELKHRNLNGDNQWLMLSSGGEYGFSWGDYDYAYAIFISNEGGQDTINNVKERPCFFGEYTYDSDADHGATMTTGSLDEWSDDDAAYHITASTNQVNMSLDGAPSQFCPAFLVSSYSDGSNFYLRINGTDNSWVNGTDYYVNLDGSTAKVQFLKSINASTTIEFQDSSFTDSTDPTITFAKTLAWINSTTITEGVTTALNITVQVTDNEAVDTVLIRHNATESLVEYVMPGNGTTNCYFNVSDVSSMMAGQVLSWFFVANDTSNNYAESTNYTITVQSSFGISSPADVDYIAGQVNNEITWTVTGRDSGSYYNITKDGDTLVSNTALESDTITLDIDGYDVGSYTIICSVNSTGSPAGTNDTVIVNVFSGPGGGGGGGSTQARTLKVNADYDNVIESGELLELIVTLLDSQTAGKVEGAGVDVVFMREIIELEETGSTYEGLLETEELDAGSYTFTIKVSKSGYEYAEVTRSFRVIDRSSIISSTSALFAVIQAYGIQLVILTCVVAGAIVTTIKLRSRPPDFVRNYKKSFEKRKRNIFKRRRNI